MVGAIITAALPLLQINRYGITHNALTWFLAYLAEKYQCVSISVQINHMGLTRQCIGSSAVFIICRTYWIYY